jgi:ACS family hexuronate transporter-like MFS transporter
VRHLNLSEIAMFAWLPFLTADLGCLAAGYISKFLNNRGIHIINAKRITFTFAALLMLAMAAVGYVSNVYVAIGLFCIAGFAHQCLSITVISMSSDLFPKQKVATVTGFAAFTGSMGNFGFSLFLGAMVAVVGYNMFFIGLGVFDLIGAAFLWTLIKRPSAELKPAIA